MSSTTAIRQVPGPVRRAVLERRANILAEVAEHRHFTSDGEDNTHDRVLHAAVPLFARRGFDACTVRDLASEVGLTSPALYNHFSSKRQIFVEAMWLSLGSFLQSVLEPLQDEQPERWLEQIVRRHTLRQLEYQEEATANDLLMQHEQLAHTMNAGEYQALAGVEREYARLIRELTRWASRTRSADRAMVDGFAIIAMCERVNIWYRPSGHLSPGEVADLTWAAAQRLLGIT